MLRELNINEMDMVSGGSLLNSSENRTIRLDGSGGGGGGGVDEIFSYGSRITFGASSSFLGLNSSGNGLSHGGQGVYGHIGASAPA